jgi:hypothetical protein
MLVSYEGFGALLRAAAWQKNAFLALFFSQRHVSDRLIFFLPHDWLTAFSWSPCLFS